MRWPVVIRGFPPRMYVWWRGGYRRTHHVWLGIAYALTDLADWRVWISDFRKIVD